jgi:hypothetical protein
VVAQQEPEMMQHGRAGKEFQTSSVTGLKSCRELLQFSHAFFFFLAGDTV